MVKPPDSAAPPRAEQPDAPVLTGNHTLAFPRIGRTDAGVHSLNVLHRGLRGLVEWAAARDDAADAPPLLAVRVEGDADAGPPLDWQLLDGWVPSYRGRHGKLRLTGTICAPGGTLPVVRGGVIALEVANEGVTDATAEIVLEGAWRWSLLSIASTRPLHGDNRLIRSADGNGVVLEAGGTAAGAALAVRAGFRGGTGATADAPDFEVSHGVGDFAPLEPGDEIGVPNGTMLRFRIRRRVTLPPRRRATIAFYIGAGTERDGALNGATALHRTGADELIHIARLDLARLGRRADDPALGAVLNRNLLYACQSAVARAIDDDLLYPVASRSRGHGSTAVVNERAALLWTLPALLLVDDFLARELLLRMFEQYASRSGEPRKYVDGAMLAPGLQLDGILAYPLALDGYVRTTRDESILDEPVVQEMLRECDEVLFSLLHPEAFLCGGEMLPSGEPADHEFQSYGNVLAWAYASALPRIRRAHPDEPPARFDGAGPEIAAAIWQRCTADIDGSPVLGYSSDLEGGVAIYDDPDGSLALLPHLGFCGADDPIWADTMELLRSPRYPLWIHNVPFPGLAGRSAPGVPRMAGLCAELLGPRAAAALDVIRRLPLHGGIAAEAYDAHTGEPAAAPFAAAHAALLAWSLDHALRAAGKAERKGSRNSDRKADQRGRRR
jgi:uncharacterized protein